MSQEKPNKPEEQDTHSEEKELSLLDSLDFVGDSGMKEVVLKTIRSRDIDLDSSLQGATIICCEMSSPDGGNRSDLYGLRCAVNMIAQDPNQKILLCGFLPQILFGSVGFVDSKNDHLAKHVFALPNVGYFQHPPSKQELEQITLRLPEEEQDKEKVMQLISAHASRLIATLKHMLEPQRFQKSPYHPVNEGERQMVAGALEKAREFFPGLDSTEKALDYILNVEADIPEVMSGERIEGVYVDFDGTLVEYLPIGSDKEGTQKLRTEVVDLLISYEEEGKEIIIWTGGDVNQKRDHLRSLGIDWPVVSKYDYAGATAEVVIDDTDKGAFVAQSKIRPETYINTSNLDE